MRYRRFYDKASAYARFKREPGRKEAYTSMVVYITAAGNHGVKKRIGCRYVNGKNRPVNGPTVGYITSGKYVPIEKKEGCLFDGTCPS